MAVLVVIVLLTCFVPSIRSNSCHHACKRSSETRMSYQGDSYYRLALEQPQGLHYVQPKKYIKVQGAPTWTIHGLWLSSNGEPKTCCTELGPFHLSNISQDLQSEMKVSWMSLTKKTNEKFWSHEWCKHGDCVVRTFESQDNPTNAYFSRTVQLYQKYNIKDILDKNGITAGNEHKGSEIIEAIRDEINVTPQITCEKSKGQQVLIKLMLCFRGTSFDLADCTESTATGYENSEKCGDKVLYNPELV